MKNKKENVKTENGNLPISDVIHSDNMGIDAEEEMTKLLREECKKSYGDTMGIDIEEEIKKQIRKIS